METYYQIIFSRSISFIHAHQILVSNKTHGPITVNIYPREGKSVSNIEAEVSMSPKGFSPKLALKLENETTLPFSSVPIGPGIDQQLPIAGTAHFVACVKIYDGSGTLKATVQASGGQILTILDVTNKCNVGNGKTNGGNCEVKTEDQKYMWEWCDACGWKPYDLFSSNLMEKSYIENKDSITLKHDIFGSGGGYTIDFKQKTQTKLATSYVRKIRRVPVPTWEWLEGSSWRVYDGPTSLIIESAYALGQPSVDLNHYFFGTQGGYTIDFSRMVQIKKSTQFERQIQRRFADSHGHKHTM